MLRFGHRGQSSWRDGKHPARQAARRCAHRNSPVEPITAFFQTEMILRSQSK